MRVLRKVLVGALIGMPAVVMAGKIQNDFDSSAEFSNYTTYVWREGVRAPDSSLHEQIVRSIDTELSAKFLRRIDGNPDLYVVYYASPQEMTIDMNEHGYSYGPQWRWGGGVQSDSAAQTTYPKGTLVVDLWVAQTQRLVWRGVATDVVGKGADKLAEEIQKMFAGFPPPRG